MYNLPLNLPSKEKNLESDSKLPFLVSGGIADSVAKWVFKQDLNLPLLRLERQREETGSGAEPPQIDSSLFAEGEDQKSLKTILGIDVKQSFDVHCSLFCSALSFSFIPYQFAIPVPPVMSRTAS